MYGLFQFNSRRPIDHTIFAPAECNNQGKGCTAFTFSTNTSTCNTYKASGNQGRQRLTYRYNATMPGGTLQTTIYVKGSKPRALFGALCG